MATISCVIFFTVIFLTLVPLVTVTSEPIVSNFHREEPCSAKQGFCVLENECPTCGTTELKGLCPNQKSEGAICCIGLKQENMNCYQLHNDCKEKCPTNLNLGQKGCPENNVCCVLV